ncbi:I78 family peptidase inhibitor [Paracoccus laeviglucosivorans]|uniref:Peptidase inhibitor I78 family protein n=1 Tax=Paracoccus laeviglucosivorans TaxID=1197861 RepID=A0A521DQY4_9RHOB|nr:I78 family peptidase inhibitor [Paracoccus laeviglucosivorans]SMO74114.1 Peptidase inhibitor I78 family protein [Paracoccus laeviglucosivorans]
MRMRALAAPLALLVLAACEEQAPAPVSPSQPPTEDACGASRFQGLVGQSKDAVAKANLPEDARIIGPNDAVTMDFRPARLNVEIGTDDRVARVGCY